MLKLQSKPGCPPCQPIKAEPLIPKRQRKLVMTFGILALLFVFFVGIGVWSFVNRLEESVPGIGEIIPTGNLRRVMAPVNGTVVTFLVKENQRVKAGQPLIELDPEYAEVEKSGFSEQLSYLHDQITALESAYQGARTGQISNSDFGDIQHAWLTATQRATEAKLTSARMQISKSEHLYYEALARKKKTETLLVTDQTMLEKYQNLYDKGGLPLKDLEAYRQQVINRKGELKALTQEVAARRLEWEQAKQEPTAILGDYNRNLLSNITDLKRSMSEMESNLGKVNVMMERQVIRAPMDGMVHQLEISGTGEYVTAGAPLFSIVPDDAEMVAEVKVTNRDLSYIHLNQKALLQIDAFPYQQFGKLEGIIESISPSTMKDPQGFPYYMVRIKPNRTVFEKDGQTHPLRSGMTLNAQIITRDKSIISFFTEPITKHLEKAFRDPSKY